MSYLPLLSTKLERYEGPAYEFLDTDHELPALPPSINLDGHGLRIAIVVARYHWHITGTMLELAQETLLDLGVAAENIVITTVPGAFELPTMASAMLAHAHFDALICFGCVMKGATRHDIVVSDAAARGIQQVSLNTGVPTIFGVMCAENQQQAEERIERGRECAQNAIEMARAIRAVNRGMCTMNGAIAENRV